MNWLRVVCLLAALLPALTGAAGADEPKRILLLYSLGPHFSPWNTIAASFREELRRQSPKPIDLYEASLQVDRFSEGQIEGPFLEYLRSLFREGDISLIVAVGAPAARFILRNRTKLFPSTPLLVGAPDVRAISDMTLGSNEAVVASAIDETRHIEGILRVLPETTDIVVAIGDSPPERFWKVLLQHSFERFAGRVNFHWLNGLSANEMISRAANLPPRHAIYYATVRVDAAGAPQEGDRVLLRFFETARAPVFTYVDSHLGEGIVGGPMISSDELAGKVAAAARRILDGESPSAVTTPPVGDAPPVYDWRQLQRWKIAESALPPGSIVKFREVTTWQQYRLEILAVVAVILLQGVLITVLMYEHRRRTLAEIQSRESILELSRLNRFAAAGELSASLAHEIGQPITGIELLAGAARQCLASPKPDVEKVRSLLDQISRAGREAHDMIKSVRGMFRNDGPTKKAPIDINSLLRKMLAIADIELRADRIRVEIDFDDDLTPVEGNAIQLQQIVLNLIINAREAMRGETSRVLTIQSTQSLPGVVEVLIGDTGQGIPPEERERIFDPLFTTKTSGMGMGLSICRSIIEGHGGRLWVTSGGNKGAVLHFELRSIVAERPDVELPAAASDVTVGQPEEPEADAPPPRRARRAAGHAA